MNVGILGGGQLSRMLALAGTPLGLNFYFFEPNKPCCSERLGTVTYANFDDCSALEQFLKPLDIVTYENENIPVETIQFIEKLVPIHPGVKALEICQDRLFEKQFFESLDILTAPYKPIDSINDVKQALVTMGYPVILKKRRGGYDGKSQRWLRTDADVAQLTQADAKSSIVEGVIPFDREISIIAARALNGNVRVYDISENKHCDGILDTSHNSINDPCDEKAKENIKKVMNELNYVGVLALELFQSNHQLIANEMAPRVHNSGHWTIEGAHVSQFENHLRAILGWPLGRTDSLARVTMKNMIGEITHKERLLEDDNAHLHDYQKEPRAGRKLGHVTYVNGTVS